MTHPALSHLEDADMDFEMHTIEAMHTANQAGLKAREERVADLIRDALYGPIRTVSLRLEHNGTNYRDTERILRKYLGDAIAEITTTLD